jgi:hypothetical protein
LECATFNLPTYSEKSPDKSVIDKAVSQFDMPADVRDVKTPDEWIPRDGRYSVREGDTILGSKTSSKYSLVPVGVRLTTTFCSTTSLLS